MTRSPCDGTAGQAFCDLHLHTTNSDGLMSPEEVIERAGRAALRVMSISDHSRTTYDAGLEALAAAHGTILLPGLEISTMHHDRKYHVLGYGHGVLDAKVQEFAFRPTAVKNDVYGRVLAGLRAAGTPLPATEDILAGVQEDGPPLHPRKWMLSATLIGRYLARPLDVDPVRAAAVVRERYNAMKSSERDRYVPTERAIAMVRDAGGIPVIAHPFWECHSGRNSWGGVVGDLGRFTAAGLAGVEVSSRHDSPADEDRRREAAHRLRLVPFRSSDFHGNGKTAVGQFPMPVEHLIEAADRCGVDIPLHGSGKADDGA
ncbi:PHP domain-containing protein [Nonomuraea sp. B10E15]|uniref:PHP domain-containing protein n=1 Tax=Nonomuraea sp. B10E15 TaxID=3153560 RepID=UPI00325CAA15